MTAPIPTVLRIDVEPDDHQVTASTQWDGFLAMADLVNRLRARLEARRGSTLRPTWFFRLDPDIARAFGRADFVVERHGVVVDRLRADGDPVGIHVHAYRWDERRRVAYSDYADGGWATHCLEVSAVTFERRFGEPARRACQGGYFLAEALVDATIALGIQVDVTAEPGLAAKTTDPSFGAYATAPSTDFRRFPRRPYLPSRRDVGVPAASTEDARPLLMVPLTAYDFQTALAPLRRRIARRLLGRPRRHLPLNPWRSWPSPQVYWDLVARAVEEQPAPYLALAIRTDAPGSVTYRRAQALLESLPDHPIADRLLFVDPLGPEIGRLAATPGR